MGDRKAPRPRPSNQTKPAPPPAPPGFMTGRGRALRVRSKASGKEGVVFIDDPQFFVDGQGVAGWYRLETLHRDFLVDLSLEEPPT